jgi:hypothetical protein
MFGKKFVITSFVGIASIALPAFSQSENPDKNEVSVQAFGSLAKSTTDNGIENQATDLVVCLGRFQALSAYLTSRVPRSGVRLANSWF